VKHIFWVVRYKDGTYLQKSAVCEAATQLQHMDLFTSRRAATQHVKWLRSCSPIYIKWLIGCRYFPVYARLETT
jgi:hypothetical protein